MGFKILKKGKKLTSKRSAPKINMTRIEPNMSSYTQTSWKLRWDNTARYFLRIFSGSIPNSSKSGGSFSKSSNSLSSPVELSG